MLIVTLVSYGNLYLSNQLELHELLQQQMLRNQLFVFQTKKGKAFANYLEQWLECQKKRGAIALSLQPAAGEQDLNAYFYYENRFSIVCHFPKKSEIWSCCYPKTIASSYDLNHDDINTHNGSITYVLSEENEMPISLNQTDWEALAEKVRIELYQLWEIPTDRFSLKKCNYYFGGYNESRKDDFPLLPADPQFIIVHQLISLLEQLLSDFKHDNHPKNEGNAYFRLSSDEYQRYQKYGRVLEKWRENVLILAGSETRWQLSLDDIASKRANIGHNQSQSICKLKSTLLTETSATLREIEQHEKLSQMSWLMLLSIFGLMGCGLYLIFKWLYLFCWQ